MLSDIEIKKLIRYCNMINRPLINPYDEKRLGPMSYDLVTEVVEDTDNLVKLVTKEYIIMPREYYGILMPRSRIAFKGLDVIYGTLVDPGFEGNLVIIGRFIIPHAIHYGYDNLFQLLIGKVDGKVGIAYNERKTSTAMNRKGF
jgi:deoxycytidine triphosphate deaminase